ncbi:hypothetical protein SO802_005997, partial [Lithocarpus litseifolius]
MALPPEPPKFLTSNEKRYEPSIEWDDVKGLLQELLKHASNPSPKDLKNFKSQGSLQLLKQSWLVLSPNIREVINAA